MGVCFLDRSLRMAVVVRRVKLGADASDASRRIAGGISIGNWWGDHCAAHRSGVYDDFSY